MSSFQSQCCPPPTVIPGPPGLNAYSYTTAQFNGVAIGSAVSVSVANVAQYALNEYVLIPGVNIVSQTVVAGYFQIQQIGSTSMSLIAVNNSTGWVFYSGSNVLPVGSPGASGANGVNGFATLSSNYTVPSAGLGNATTAQVISSSMFVVGQYVIGYSSGAAGPANFLITAIPNSSSVTLEFVSNPGDVAAGSVLSTGSNLVPAGEIGVSAYTILTAQITIPAVGSSVNASVVNTSWMTTGAVVVMPGPAHFSVASISSTTAVTLTFLGYIGDLAPTNTIANGSVVAPSGTQPFASTTLAAYSSGSAYTLTATSAQIVFGGTTPSITLPAAGTWMIFAKVTLGAAGAASSGFLTALLQRTNNTAGAVPNSSQTINFIFATTAYVDVVVDLPVGVYQTNTAGDNIQIWGSQTNEAGSFAKINSASISAYRIA